MSTEEASQLTPELKQLIDDKNWWHCFGQLFDWKLIGWTTRRTATFNTGNSPHETLQLTGAQAQAILDAFRNKK